MEQQKKKYRCFSTGRGFYIRVPVSESQEPPAHKEEDEKQA